MRTGQHVPSSRASCSGRGSTNRHRSRGDSHACYASKAVAEIVPDHIAEKIQEGVAQLNPTFYRNGEPLQDQIHISVQEAMATDAINQEDMDYWFSEGPGDIDVSVPLKVCPVKGHVEFTARSGHVRAPGLEVLREGQVYIGKVTKMHVMHGAFIDIGNAWLGCIPVDMDRWGAYLILHERLTMDMEVKVRVYKVRPDRFHRFPVQLEPMDPDIAPLVIPPHEWYCPVFRMVGEDPAEVQMHADPEWQPPIIHGMDKDLQEEDAAFNEREEFYEEWVQEQSKKYKRPVERTSDDSRFLGLGTKEEQAEAEAERKRAETAAVKQDRIAAIRAALEPDWWRDLHSVQPQVEPELDFIAQEREEEENAYGQDLPTYKKPAERLRDDRPAEVLEERRAQEKAEREQDLCMARNSLQQGLVAMGKW